MQLVILSEAKDLCNLPAAPTLQAKCTGPSARKSRGPQDDKTVLYTCKSKSSPKRKWPPRFLSMAIINAGNDLLSHTLSRAVQSALRGLTSVFGMGTGGTPAVRSPTCLAAF